MSDQIIKVELIFETKQSLNELKAVTQLVNDLKRNLTELANETKAAGVPIDQLGMKLSQVFKNRKADIDALIKATKEYERYLSDMQKFRSLGGVNNSEGTKKPVLADYDVGDFSKKQLVDFRNQILELGKAFDLVGFNVTKFEELYRRNINEVIKETQQAAMTVGKYDQNIVTSNADVARSVELGNQVSAAQQKATTDLNAYLAAQGKSITETNALANAKQALIKAYREEQLKPFEGKLATGAYDTQELALANKRVKDYEDALNKAGTAALKLAQFVEKAIEQSNKLVTSAQQLGKSTISSGGKVLPASGVSLNITSNIEDFKRNLASEVKSLRTTLGPEFINVGKSLKKSLVEGYSEERFRDINARKLAGQVISKEEIAQANKDVANFKKLVNEVIDAETKLAQSQTKVSAVGISIPDINKAVQASQQEAQALALVKNDLVQLMNARKIAVGDTVALTKAQQDLVTAFKQQVVLPAQQKYGIDSQQAKQAEAELDKYTANSKTAMGEIKQGWQETARVEAQADREAKKQKKAEEDREKLRVRAWQNEQKSLFKKTQGGMTSTLPPTGWGADKTTDELKRMATASKETAGAFSSLGGIARTVFGGILGITAVSAIRDFIQMLNQGVDAAIEFEKSTTLLEIGIRALQKTGFDTTVDYWTASLAEFKKQFPIFTQQEIVGGYSVAILKLREYGASQEEINRILEISGTLALAYGRDFQEMVNSVSGAITRGYFEALQSMGIAIGRINIMQDAMQEGLTGGLQALTEQERFRLAFNILEENVGVLEEDFQNLGTEGEAAFIQLRAATAASTDALRELGETFIEIKVKAAQAKAGVLEFLASIAGTTTSAEEDAKRLEEIKALQMGIAETELEISRIKLEQYNNTKKLAEQGEKAGLSEQEIANNIADANFNYQNRIDLLTENLGLDKDRLKELKEQESAVERQNRLGWEQVEIQKQIKQNYKQQIAVIKLDTTLSEEEKKTLIDAANAAIADAENEIDRLKIEYELVPAEDVVAIPVDYQGAFDDVIDGLQTEWLKVQDEIGQLQVQLDVELNVAFVDYQDELAEIEADLTKSIADAWSSYYKSLADLDRDYQQSVAQSQADHRRDELRAEEDHLKDMRRLREDYIMDLQDALRERDAVAIMRLTREYNVEKQRREEDYADQKRQRDEDYARQKAERQAEYQQRRAELQYELQERLKLLQIEAQQRRDEAKAEYEKELEELKLKHEEEKKALEAALQEQFDIRMAKMIETLQLTDEQLEAMDQYFKDHSDESSPLAKMWKTFRDKAKKSTEDASTYTRIFGQTFNSWMTSALLHVYSLTGALNNLKALLASMKSSGFYFNYGYPMGGGGSNLQWGNPGGFAEGGRVYGGRTILVGEEGPELFVPDVSGEIVPSDVTSKIVKDMAMQHQVGFRAEGMPDLSATVTQAGIVDYNTNVNGRASQEEKVSIDVWLSPDLEGRIVGKATKDMAKSFDVILRRR